MKFLLFCLLYALAFQASANQKQSQFPKSLVDKAKAEVFEKFAASKAQEGVFYLIQSVESDKGSILTSSEDYEPTFILRLKGKYSEPINKCFVFEGECFVYDKDTSELHCFMGESYPSCE